MLKDFKDILVLPRKNDLKDTFLACVQDACKKTIGSDQPVLLLVFGHGSELTCSITIGGTTASEECPSLEMTDLKAAMRHQNPNPNVSMLTLSCYGGGWVQNAFLNMTAMAGATEGTETLSWPKSGSQGRCCGSRFATALAQALIKQQIQDLDLEKEEKLLDSPTYAALVKVVHDTLVEEVDTQLKNEISFSAQDDAWGMEWRAKSGFPLSTFHEKWQTLKMVPQGAAAEGSSHLGSVRISDLVTLSTSQAELKLTREARDYMRSFPGPDEAAKNHLTHGLCRDLLKGKTLGAHDLERLARQLSFRSRIMRDATDYKDRLGLTSPDCHEYNMADHLKEIQKDQEKHAAYSAYIRITLEHGLFDQPVSGEGHEFSKGGHYLAAVMVEAGWDRDTVVSVMAELAKVKGKPISTDGRLEKQD